MKLSLRKVTRVQGNLQLSDKMLRLITRSPRGIDARVYLLQFYASPNKNSLILRKIN
jgi:hypothetical protein